MQTATIKLPHFAFRNGILFQMELDQGKISKCSHCEEDYYIMELTEFDEGYLCSYCESDFLHKELEGINKPVIKKAHIIEFFKTLFFVCSFVVGFSVVLLSPFIVWAIVAGEKKWLMILFMMVAIGAPLIGAAHCCSKYLISFLEKFIKYYFVKRYLYKSSHTRL